mmetsp:Transcript_151585/g.368141  ORF Transcript_151585/g.368141 Transcript_151585/m.368141 type:complete len:201 (-) Transcript_151585:165-767(-)
MPRSLMSLSSMSDKVSSSSNPLCNNAAAYWLRPMSFRNATTGLPSSSSSPSPPCLCSSCRRLRSFTTWQGFMPTSFMSASSMCSNVSISSKPLASSASVYCDRPSSLRKAATSPLSSWPTTPSWPCLLGWGLWPDSSVGLAPPAPQPAGRPMGPLASPKPDRPEAPPGLGAAGGWKPGSLFCGPAPCPGAGRADLGGCRG